MGGKHQPATPIVQDPEVHPADPRPPVAMLMITAVNQHSGEPDHLVDNAPVRAIKGDTSGQGPGDTAAQPPAVIALPTRGRGWHHRTGASIRAARAIGKDRAPRHRRTSSSACFHPGRVDERASRARWDRWRRLIRMLSGGIKGDVSAPQGQLCQPGRRWPGWLVRAAAPC